MSNWFWLGSCHQGPTGRGFLLYKKPKGKSLSTEQKQENNVISSFRIVIEHAIGGIKRFGCMAQKYRNHKGKDDQMIKLCAGLWNFHIQNS